MTQLDNVIRRISESEASKITASGTQKVVIIDVKKKKVLPKKPFFFGGDLQYFLVSNENDVSHIARSDRRFAIDNFATNRKIGVLVEYQVTCPPGNEQMAALALCDANTPSAALEGKIMGWLKEYSNTKFTFDEFTSNYDREFNNLRVYAETKAKQEIGLNLNLRLSLELDKADKLKPFSVNLSWFPVLVSDYEQELDFKFATNLLISENGKVNAILQFNNQGKLEEILREETRNYLRKNVSLHNFCYQLNDSVSPNLAKHLDGVLVPYGRKIEYLSAEIDKKLLMPDSFSMKHNIACEIQEYGLVDIKNALEIEPRLEDIVKYIKAEVSNLETWFKAKLEKIVKQQLFDCKYIDLLLDFEPIESKIKEELQKEAEGIGYSIRLITTVPDLEPLKLKDEGFNFEINDTFATRESNVKVKLKIIVSGKIKNLKKIERFLNLKRDVPDLIKNKVFHAVTQQLYEIDPDHFYLHFDYYSEGLSVKSNLLQLIEKILVEEFHASELNLIAQSQETELTERFKKLQSQPYRFEVVIESLQDLQEQVRYYGSFQVERVAKDKWHIFQSREYTIENIQEFLQDHLRSRLETLNTNRLKYENIRELKEAEDNIGYLAMAAIKEQFGLEISIKNLGRDRTELEVDSSDTSIKRQKDRLIAPFEEFERAPGLRQMEYKLFEEELGSKQLELRQVREKIREVITQEDNEDEIEELRKKEKSLKKKVDKILKKREKYFKIAEEQNQSLAPQSSQEEGFGSLTAAMGLSLPSTNSNSEASLPGKNLNSESESATGKFEESDEAIDVEIKNPDR